jgi:serine/threonine kinase 32
MGTGSSKPISFSDEVNLNHFRLLRVVGKGAFGKVRIVERKDTGLTFALKYIRKDEVVRSESVRNIIRERRMLEHMNHPFLCNLRYSFQDIEYLYIVVDLMNGGDLRFHITRKTFTEEAVRFWLSELACALRYIHGQGIVHRDVKPDNVLLDSEGHVHLADFNVASDFSPSKLLTSKSGTLAYLAPEVYEGKGYLSEVDWWSLGVLFYECIYSKRPFEGSSHSSLTAKIVKAEPAFPVTNPPVSMNCLRAIKALLEKDRTKRIGATGFHTFTDHPFFRPIDFEALEAKEIEPVFTPSSDKTNFDATYDLEELLLEEAPLEARARRQKPREQLKDDATQQEIRTEELHKMIETLFEPFNYMTVNFDKQTAAAALQATKEGHPHTNSSTAHNSTAASDGGASIHQDENLGSAPASGSSPPRDGNLRPSGSKTKLHRSRSTKSPSVSPPLPPSSASAADDQGPTSAPRQNRQQHQQAAAAANQQVGASGEAVAPVSFSRPRPNGQLKATRGSTRSTSAGGGTQVVLNEDGVGSWTEVGNSNKMQKNGTPEEGRPSGMLGFLSRRRGRDRSPKAKERGVLGKEGARVIISNG